MKGESWLAGRHIGQQEGAGGRGHHGRNDRHQPSAECALGFRVVTGEREVGHSNCTKQSQERAESPEDDVDPDRRRQSHPWAARREGVSATELAATPLIVRSQALVRGVRSSVPCRSFRPPLTMARPAAELPTTSSILTTVIAGSVPAVVSILAARDALTSGQLVRVKITDIRIVRPLTAVWLRTTAELPEELQDLLRIATA